MSRILTHREITPRRPDCLDLRMAESKSAALPLGEAPKQIDVDASIMQIENAPPLRRKPVVVLTKTEPFAQPPSVVSFPFGEVERIWPKGAENLVKLEPDTPHIFATGSDHYIQINQPDLVIASIRLVIERAKQGK